MITRPPTNAPRPPPRPLADERVIARLEGMPGWSRDADCLVREFRFPSYMDGITFVNRVAGLAEEMDHHPDLAVSWKRVTVRLTSHDAGGITGRDFTLAGRIDALCPVAGERSEA